MDTDAALLQAIEVSNLFGQGQAVSIVLDPVRPTVLTGANGTGKSTILRLVNAVSSGDWTYLASAPFDALALHFEKHPSLLAAKSDDRGMHLSWGQEIAYMPPIDAIGHLPDWVMESLGGQLDLGEVLSSLQEVARNAGVRYEEYREVRDQLRRLEAGEAPQGIERPDWLNQLTENFSALFVTDQRLVVESTRELRRPAASETKARSLAVEAAAADLANRIRRADSLYARASQQQDRRFPRDVINAMRRNPISPSDLRKLVADVERQREALRQVGLFDVDDVYEPKLSASSFEDPAIRPVVATFLRATLRKLQVLDRLGQRLIAFKDFLDQRFSPKYVILSRQEGLRFGLPDGSVISPRQLSSGEQQMLVLAYEILFRAEAGTLVLIDEPEISLHVLWQDTLIDDLTRMASASELRFLMATHSAMILAGHPELERSLDPADVG